MKMSILPEDVAQHRTWLRSLVGLPEAARVVDLGAGRGDDLIAFARATADPDARFIGYDESESSVSSARECAGTDTRISFQLQRIGSTLPLEDQSVDLVYSNNLLECLPSADHLVEEAARVLRPGGHLLVAHWDWDTQVFDGPDKGLIRRLVHAFADWQQAWMEHSDGWMGRRLWGTVHPLELFSGTMHARTLVNTHYEAPWFGYANAQAFESLARRGLVPSEDVEEFHRTQRRLYAEGRYFFSITGYAYLGQRRTPNA